MSVRPRGEGLDYARKIQFWCFINKIPPNKIYLIKDDWTVVCVTRRRGEWIVSFKTDITKHTKSNSDIQNTIQKNIKYRYTYP